jgi:hypothetical protein
MLLWLIESSKVTKLIYIYIYNGGNSILTFCPVAQMNSVECRATFAIAICFSGPAQSCIVS